MAPYVGTGGAGGTPRYDRTNQPSTGRSASNLGTFSAPPSNLAGIINSAPRIQPTVTPGGPASLDSLASLFGVANLPNEVMAQNQIANLQNQLGMVGAMGGVERGYANQNAGFDRQRLGIQRGLLGDQRGELAAQEGDLNYAFMRKNQNYLGNQAARGATTTTGTRRGLEDFMHEKEIAARRLNLNRRELDAMEKNLGISANELESRLTRTLDQLGLSQAMSVGDIMSAMMDVEAGRFNPISSLLGQVYALSGIRPPTPQVNVGKKDLNNVLAGRI